MKPGRAVKIHDYHRVVQAKIYIDQHYAEPTFLDGIAAEACYSKFHFLRLFREVYKVSPRQYLVRVRVSKAKEQLAAGASVADACYNSGFSSITTFSGLFKRITGVTPQTFRSRAVTRRKAIADAPLTFVPSCFAMKKGWL